MDTASQAILSLKPVTFNYKSDNTNTPQFGLIAEEVASSETQTWWCATTKGEIYTVRYDAVNAMLLNEFLKEHRQVEDQRHRLQEQEATIAELRKEMETRFREQDSKIQKVSAQLEARKPASQIVNNP